MELVKIDFDLLAKKANFGFYRRCEVTEIFLINKAENFPLNLYTLIYFQDEDFYGTNLRNITEKLKKINNNYSLGIQRYNLSISEAKKRFKFLKKNIWVGVDKVEYEQNHLELIPKQFINLGFTESRLKEILIKEDGIQSSYIIEFFNYDKEFSFNKNFNDFYSICDILNEYLGLDFNNIPERLGNFIFQFPNTIMKIDTCLTDDENGVYISVQWDKKLRNIPNCDIKLFSEFDGVILGDSTKLLNDIFLEPFNFSNISENAIKIIIYNLNNDLVLFYSSDDNSPDLNIKASVVDPNDYRIFYRGGEKQKIQLRSVKSIFERKPKEYMTCIYNSQSFNKKIKLSEELSFKQYPDKDTEDPIKDLQDLIAKNDENGVYLWDPFLTADDIFNTLFYSCTKKVPLKAITSGKVGNRDEIRKEFKINEDNCKDLNLEVRIQQEYNFHDRFLIFPSKDIYTEPKVYSLGTSVNSFGKKHHILQLVSYPELIIGAFEDLWNQLEDEKCLVWKS